MVSRARNFLDSLLHFRRRRHAAHRLRGATPRSVLFVCQGNICRSPFAAALFAQLARPSFPGPITSAGFVGPGRSPPEHARTTARNYGLDISGHRSATLTADNLRAADLIVVMSRDQEQRIAPLLAPGSITVILGDLDPLPIKQRTIHDPWDGPADAFAESYDRINRCVRELVKLVWRGA